MTTRDFYMGRVAAVGRGAWGLETTYDVLDMVNHKGQSYMSLHASNLGVDPEEDTGEEHWMLLCARGESWYQMAVRTGRFEGTEEDFLNEKQAQIDAATQAAATANEQAAYAKTQGDYAKTQGEKAGAVSLLSAELNDAIRTSESERDAAEKKRKADEASREAAEQKREANESGRVEAETERAKTFSALKTNIEASQAEWANTKREIDEREETWKAAESARATAETERVKAEESRTAAENLRTSDEQARKTAEGSRAEAETERKANEEDRSTAESARAAAESKRAAAEKERETAETLRTTTFDNLKQQIDEKQTAWNTAEQARATAEQERVTAEQARVEADAGRQAQLDAATEQATRNSGDIDRLVEAKDRIGRGQAISMDTQEWPTMCGLSMTIFANEAPSKAPDFAGQQYLDQTNKKAYVAFGASSVSDWEALN